MRTHILKKNFCVAKVTLLLFLNLFILIYLDKNEGNYIKITKLCLLDLFSKVVKILIKCYKSIIAIYLVTFYFTF